MTENTTFCVEIRCRIITDTGLEMDEKRTVITRLTGYPSNEYEACEASTEALKLLLDKAKDTLYNAFWDETVAPAHETWVQTNFFDKVS